MKAIKILLVLIIAFGLYACNVTGHGPVSIDASYPGYFYMIVAVHGPDGEYFEIVRPSPYLTYQLDLWEGERLWYVGVYAHKFPDDVAPQGDLGTLQVTITGSFGVLQKTAPLGDLQAIKLERSWAHPQD